MYRLMYLHEWRFFLATLERIIARIRLLLRNESLILKQIYVVIICKFVLKASIFVSTQWMPHNTQFILTNSVSDTFNTTTLFFFSRLKYINVSAY